MRRHRRQALYDGVHDGTLGLHDLASGEIAWSTRLSPRAGGSAAGAVVSAPGAGGDLASGGGGTAGRVGGASMATATGAGAGTLYPYYDVAPVTLAPNHPYTVAVALAGSGGDWGLATLPVATPDATVQASCYAVNPGATSTGDPCRIGAAVTNVMYGAADVLAWVAPTITGQPTPMTVDAGAPAYFVISDTTSCGLITTRWQRNGVNLSDGGPYSGTQTAVLQISSATAAELGSYRAVVACANGGGTTYSEPAALLVRPIATVTAPPPIISSLGVTSCGAGGCTVAWSGPSGPIDASSLTLTPAGGAPIDVTGLGQRTVAPATTTVYTLTATSAAGSYAQNVVVPAGGYTETVTGCRTIDMPGRYLVTTSLTTTSTTTPCLDLRDNHDIYLDCSPGVVIRGPAGPALYAGAATPPGALGVTRVQRFAIRGCTFEDNGGAGGAFLASFQGSSLGVVSGSTFGASAVTTRLQAVQAFQTSYVTFTSDTLYALLELNGRSHGVAVVGSTLINRFPGAASPRLYTSGNIVEDGAGDQTAFLQVVGSTLDGGATGATLPGTTIFAGADDGIAGAGSGTLIAGNTLRNFWDAAIEWITPTIRNTVYANVIQNAGYAAINWNRQGDSIGGLIAGNRIDSSAWPTANLGLMLRSAPAAGATGHFQRNGIRDNQIVNGAHSQPSELTIQGPWAVGGNTFANNQFNANGYPGIAAPTFTTPYTIWANSDGGSNKGHRERGVLRRE